MLSLFIFVFFSHVLVVVNSLNWALLGSGYGLMSTRLFSSPSSSISSQTRPPVRVVVTGAGDSVGYILFKKLLKRKQFYPIGLVRDNASYRKLIREGALPDQITIGDITNKDSIKGLFHGADKAVLCTSARPKKKLWFKLKSLIYKILYFFNLVPDIPLPGPDDLYYKKNQTPHDVDYIGQRHVIDQCVASSVNHVVLLGNMGGYRSKLNEINKWKRAAERYLMKRVLFTIIHSGALTDEPGGRREIVWDTDDSLLRTSFKKIPREDLAEVLIQSLIWKEAIGRSIDVGSRPEGKDAIPTKDWLRFFARPGNNLYPADEPKY